VCRQAAALAVAAIDQPRRPPLSLVPPSARGGEGARGGIIVVIVVICLDKVRICLEAPAPASLPEQGGLHASPAVRRTGGLLETVAAAEAVQRQIAAPSRWEGPSSRTGNAAVAAQRSQDAPPSVGPPQRSSELRS